MENTLSFLKMRKDEAVVAIAEANRKGDKAAQAYWQGRYEMAREAEDLVQGKILPGGRVDMTNDLGPGLAQIARLTGLSIIYLSGPTPKRWLVEKAGILYKACASRKAVESFLSNLNPKARS